MLIDGRKFDIRAFALVTHDGCVHFAHDWIVRTCSEPFDMTVGLSLPGVRLVTRTYWVSSTGVFTAK
jgi:hypothetical protein